VTLFLSFSASSPPHRLESFLFALRLHHHHHVRLTTHSLLNNPRKSLSTMLSSSAFVILTLSASALANVFVRCICALFPISRILTSRLVFLQYRSRTPSLRLTWWPDKHSMSPGRMTVNHQLSKPSDLQQLPSSLATRFSRFVFLSALLS
jgi:hypothetical protein